MNHLVRIACIQRTILIGCVVALLFLMTSCSGETSPDQSSGERLAGSLVDLFQEELASPDLTEFEREVLTRAVSTGGISDVDYESAFQLYRQCLDDAGQVVSWTKGSDGIHQASPHFESQEDVNRWSDDSLKCATGTVFRIEALYRIQQNNPGLYADPFQAVIVCWQRVGKSIPNYGVEDLRRDITSMEEDSATPSSFDLSDDDVWTCLSGNGFSFGS